MAGKPNPPAILGEPGRELWLAVVETYELRADEYRTLEDACAATDMLAEFQAQWVEMGRPLISRGSMGQEVEHPLIGSIDKQRKARQAFFRQLHLPDSADRERPNQQREAAQSRWAAAHGKGA